MNSIDIWNDLGNIYLKANAMDSAIDAYNRALEQGYQTGDLYKNLAGAYVSQGNILESIPFFQKSIELLSDEREKALVFTRIGDCYRRMGDYENAIQSFKSAIEIEPGNPELCIGLGEVQRELEKLFGFDGSVNPENLVSEEVLCTQVALQPDNTTFENNEKTNRLDAVEIGDEYAMVSNTDVNSLTLEPFVAMNLNEAPIGNECGEADDNLSKPNEGANLAQNLFKNVDSTVFMAETIYQAAEKVDLTVLTMGHEHLVDNSQQLDSEENREKEDGVRVTLLLTLGIMHWRNGSLEDAEGILQSAINVSVKIKNTWFEALAWHSLALVKTALGDIQSAIHAYLRAMELAPDQIFPWNNLGTLYGSLGSNDKAMAAFQKAIRLHPEDPTSWDGLGDVYTKLGRLDDAIASYQLGNVFEKRAQGDDAIKVYEKALDFYKMTIASFEDEVTTTQEHLKKATEDRAGSDEILQLDEYTHLKLKPEILAKFAERMIFIDPGIQFQEETGNLETENLEVEVDSIEEHAGEIDETQLDVVTDNELVAEAVEPVQPSNVDMVELHDKATEDNKSARFGPIVSEIPVINPAGLAEPEEEHVLVRYDVEEKPFVLGELEENPSTEIAEQNYKTWVAVTEICVPDVDAPEVPSQEDWSPVVQLEVPLNIDEPVFTQPEVEQVVNVPSPVEQIVIPAASKNNIEDQSIALPEVATVQVSLSTETHDVQVEEQARVESGILQAVVDGSLPPIVTVEPVTVKQDPSKTAGDIASKEAVVRENPRNDRAWDSLGHLYRITQRNNDAINAFEHAIALEPNKYVYHYQLGTLHAAEGNYTAAIVEMEIVIELNPIFLFAHCALASYLRRLGKNEESQIHISIAAPFMAGEKEYDRACFESIRGNIDIALSLLKIALEKKQTTIEWIRRDLDIDFIRRDPRYELFEKQYSQNVIQY